MAATPEDDFLLAVPEPFSPSVFLDLPPTPRPYDNDDDPHATTTTTSDDLVLPYISRMLMEEEEDVGDHNFFYQYPDHPALLTAQQPYAQILLSASSSSSSASDSPATTTTLSPSAQLAAWPYDPVELAQLLRSPPCPDFTASVEGEAIQTSGSAVHEEDTKTNITTTLLTLPAAVGEEELDHDDALTSAFFAVDGHQAGGVVDMDMLNRAFAKGMEEASKFLPANNGLQLIMNLESTTTTTSTGGEHHLTTDSRPLFNTIGGQVKKEQKVVDGSPMFRESSNRRRGRKNNREHHVEEEDLLEAETGRTSKLMMPEREEDDTDAQEEMYRDIMTFNYDALVKRTQDLRIAKDSESQKSSGRRKHHQDDELVDLRTMLLHCAQAVAGGDSRSAHETLKQIKHHASASGDATQRLARCFAEGLEARLAGTGSLVYRSLVSKRTSVVDYLRAYQLFMAASSFKKAKYVFSNKTILDAVAGKRKLHIVEYGVQHGFQWPSFLHFLANREGGPPEVRFTGIDLPQPGFRPAYQIEKTGERLRNCARQFGVPFTFRAVAAKWETVTPDDLDLDSDEVLAVNCECYLDRLTDESVLDDVASVVDSPMTKVRSPRDTVLGNIREMRPDVFVHCVVNGTFGAPFFATRFREAMFFYSAHFDMLDATIPRDNDVRRLIERDILGRSALNVIACEGADRVERPETYKQWQVRNNRAGLRQLPLRAEVVKLVRDKVTDLYHKDFLLDEDQRWLLQGWKGRVLYAMSTWVAAHHQDVVP